MTEEEKYKQMQNIMALIENGKISLEYVLRKIGLFDYLTGGLCSIAIKQIYKDDIYKI